MVVGCNSSGGRGLLFLESRYCVTKMAKMFTPGRKQKIWYSGVLEHKWNQLIREDKASYLNLSSL